MFNSKTVYQTLKYSNKIFYTSELTFLVITKQS